MNKKIGEIAGKVWKTLEENGEMSVAQLKKTVEKNAFLLDSSIGWLAREEKVSITQKGNSVRVALK